MDKKILVVDDDADISEMLAYNLSKEGYKVEAVNNGKDAIKTAKTFNPDVILMDIMMPKMDGVEASRQLREMPETMNTFILFLTARVEEYSEIAAFEVGADDYITKPIRPRALISRINALFRRSTERKPENEEGNKIQVGDLFIDKDSYAVYKGETLVSLPKKEFDLLYFLAFHPQKVYSREDLLKHIWGEDVYVLVRTVDVHIRKIREKIGEGYIKTVKGVGYKFKVDA